MVEDILLDKKTMRIAISLAVVFWVFLAGYLMGANKDL